MRRDIPARFWFEAVTAVLGLLLFVLALVTHEWIEILTGWDPDGGNGALEIALAVSLLAISAAAAFSARRRYTTAALIG